MNKISIEIDFDVYKYLVTKSNGFNEDFNEILRREFKIEKQNLKSKNMPTITNMTQNNIRIVSDKDIRYIDNLRKNVRASGKLLHGNKFLIFSGSTMSNIEDDSISDSYKDLRKELKNKNIVNDKNVFITDYEFNSPSQAASILLGGMRDGKLIWKLK